MKCALLVLLAACGAAPKSAPVPATSTATFAGIHVEQIVEAGDTVYLFEPDKIVIVRNGLVVTTAAAPDEACTRCHWSSATTIPALDGEGRWVVATRSGSLWRVLSTGESERIGDRFGLGDIRIESIVAAGSTIALGLDDAIAITTDGAHLARYPITGELAIAAGRLAIATDHAIEIWDLARGTRISFAIEHAHPAFLAERLLAITDRGLWIEDHGKLAAIRVPVGPLTAAVAGTRLWVRAGDALFTLGDHALVRTAAGRSPMTSAALIGSPTGDLWIDGGGELQRYSLDRATADPRWTAEIAPVFQRVCSHCHLPGGDAGIDLSTPATWASERAEIVRRVLVTRTMPPAGTELSDRDRLALAGWLGGTP